MPRRRASSSRPPGERVHHELAYGITLDLFIPFNPHHARALTLETRVQGVTFSGKDLHVNLHDTPGTATVTVEEDDALGVSVDAADDVPVDFSVDSDFLTVTPDPDNPLRATIALVDAASAVGQTGVLTVTATLPDGTQAQGSEAITVVSGPVASLKVNVTEDGAGA